MKRFATAIMIKPSHSSFCSRRISTAAVATMFTIAAVSTFLVLAATYYIATTGNNSNNPSSGRRWRTIQDAVDQVNPGDSIIVGTGSYSQTVTVSMSDFPAAPISISAATGQGGSLKNSQLDGIRYGCLLLKGGT